MRKIETLDALHALYGTPLETTNQKVAARLTPLYRAWINEARFCILSTVGAEGVHGTPRGDDGPVVRIHDDTTLLMPDWMGNNRIEALRDIVSDGRVALLFMLSKSRTTVRVNGRAWLTDDPEMRASFEQRGKHPATVILIELAEVYTQCAKALIRSRLWERDDADRVPTVGEIMRDMTKGAVGGPEYDATYEERALPKLW